MPKAALKALVTVMSRGAFIVLLPLLYVVEPFWRFRLGHLAHEGRIGHLSLNHEVFLRRQNAAGWPPRTSYIIAGWGPASRQFMDMYKRAMPIIESRALKHFMLAIEPLLVRTRFHQAFPFTSLEHFEFGELPPALKFNDAEEKRGYDALAAMGIGEDDWFVCFHARDPAYLLSRGGFGTMSDEFMADPRSLRDCSIDNFIPAMRWISDQGGFAIRMGAIVEKPLPDLGPRVIDYATHHRTDFLDVYLPARNRFFFGCASGAHSGAYCFNAPIAGSNWAPYRDLALGKRTLTTHKLIWLENEDRYLTFPEIRDLGMFDPTPEQRRQQSKSPAEFARDNMIWTENTADELLDLCKDMMDLVTGVAPSPDAARLQMVFRQFYSGPNNSEYAGRIAPRFALKHRALIEPDGAAKTTE